MWPFIFSLLGSIISTFLLYCSVPLIIRFSNGMALSKKSASTIALINSIVAVVIIMAFYGITNREKSPNYAAAMFYYFINKWILSNEKKEHKKEAPANTARANQK